MPQSKPKRKSAPQAPPEAIPLASGSPKFAPATTRLLGHVRIAPNLKSILGTTVRSSSGVLDDDQRMYRDKLDELRGKARYAIPAIAREYNALPTDKQQERFALVHLLAEMVHPDALPELERIAAPEALAAQPTGPADELRLQHEAIVRMMAVEGIGRLAATGQAEAREALLRLVRHPTFSVRREAVQQYLQSGGPEAREKLQALLPKKERFLLNIRVTAPDKLPPLPKPSSTHPPRRNANAPIPPALPTGKKSKTTKPRKGDQGEYPRRGGNND